MKNKIIVLLTVIVALTLFVGLFSAFAETKPQEKAAFQNADLKEQLKKAYETPIQSDADRIERMKAIRSVLLNADVELKAEDPMLIKERQSAIDEKYSNYELEQKYSNEKDDIIRNFFEKGGADLLATAGAGLEADDFEPDNTHNQGEKLVDGFLSTKHTIYPENDVDFFWFSGNAGDIIEIVVTTPNPYWGSKDDPNHFLPPNEVDLDPHVTLYLPDRSVLVEDDDSGTGWDSFLNIQLPQSGIYYISVESSSHWVPPTVGSYEIGLKFLQADSYEPDNDFASANQLSNGDELTDHTIMPAGDSDFYKFDITVPGTALRGVIIATPSAANAFDWPELYKGDLDPAVDVFDAGGNLIYSMDDTNNPLDPEFGLYDVELMFSFPTPGTYYVRVYASGKATGYNTKVGSYKLSFDLTLPDAYEPDNLPGQANPIAYGQTIDDHTITSVLDGDMFTFVGNQGDYIRVIVSSDNKCGDLDPGVALYGDGSVGNGTWGPLPLDWLHSSMDDGEGLDARIVWGPLPYSGVYFLEVGADPLSWYNWWERSGSYSISLDLVGTTATVPTDKASAADIDFGATLSGVIPRTGVIWPDDSGVTTLSNWYKFDGLAGEVVSAKVVTPVQYRSGCGTLQSDWMEDLNPQIALLDAADNVLVLNKNIDPANEWDDAEFVYTLPADGAYYIKVDAEIVPEPPIYQFFGDADSYGEYTIRLVRKPRVTDFDSDRNVGNAPLYVNYFDHCVVEEDPLTDTWTWDASYNMGIILNGREPYYCYWQQGWHDVLKTASNGAGSVSELKEQFIHVYGPSGYAPMQLHEGVGDFAKETWDAAVDGDIYCWNGVATVKVDETTGEQPWATFSFADGKTKMINKIRIKAGAGLGNTGRWVRRVRVMAFDGVDGNHYEEIFTVNVEGGDWNEYLINPPVKAAFMKLVVLDDELDYDGWRQISEFEAYEDIVLPNQDNSLLTVTTPHLADGKDAAQITLKLVDDNGDPITVYDDKDVTFYLANCESGVFGPIDTSRADEGIFSTTLTMTEPGSYQVLAASHGAVIVNDIPGDNETPSTIAFFGNAGQKGDLIFVEGSETSKGEGWDNAIDGDREGWDGTVTSKGDVVYAIFKFSNDMKMPINKIGLATDNGLDDDAYEGRQVRQFIIQVSDDMTTWTTAYEGTRQNLGEMSYYTFPVVFGKYVKLVVTQPDGGWRQLVEFEVIFDSKEGFTAQETNVAELPTKYELSNNYPNPFNPTTTINYQLPEDGFVNVSIYNMIGQKVATLVNKNMTAGYHSIVWNAVNFPSGVYLYRIEAGSFNQTKRMVLLK